MTEEWALMRADLEKTLVPGEAPQVLLNENDKKKYGIRTPHQRGPIRQEIFDRTKASSRQYEGDYIILQQKRSH
jgi:hypothetical protein